MTTRDEQTRPLHLLVRWTARVLSVLAAGMVLLFLIGEGRPDHFLALTFGETVRLTTFFAVITGLLVAWRWEWQGAAVSLLALAAFNGLEYTAKGHLAHGAFPYFAIPAVLYLLSAAIEARRHTPLAVLNGS